MIQVSFAARFLALRIKGMKERRGRSKKERERKRRKQENKDIQIYKVCWREDSIDVRHLLFIVVIPIN